MARWKHYKRTNVAEMRPYQPGEDLTGISVSDVDDPEKDQGMIARNPLNHTDQWYVARKYFEDNFEPTDTARNLESAQRRERKLLRGLENYFLVWADALATSEPHLARRMREEASDICALLDKHEEDE